jgi:hypothetical protein
MRMQYTPMSRLRNAVRADTVCLINIPGVIQQRDEYYSTDDVDQKDRRRG